MVNLANMTPEAIEAWNRLNESWGQPINVISTYRDPVTNARVGGAKGSQHLHGNAFDISTAGMTPEQIDALIKAGAKAGFRGFGGYNNSLHFDVGPARTWGPDYGSGSTPAYLKNALAGVEFSQAVPTIMTKGGQAVEPDQIKQDALAQSTGILNMAGGQQRQAMGGQQPRQTMGERFRDPNFWNELALTFHSMSSFPNEAAIRSLESRVSTARERKKEQDQINKTIAFFEKANMPQLAELARVSPTAAINAYGQMIKPTSTSAASPLGKLVEDYKRGLITKEQLDAAIAKANAQSGGIGFRYNPETGEMEFVQGNVKLTETQSKATGFYGRASRSHQILSNLERAGTELYDAMVSNIPIAGNYMISEEYQKYSQAQRDFINALLRQESGAVISPEEFANARQQYFPQPGDSDAVIEQKRRNRETAIAGLQVAAGPGAAQIGSGAAPLKTPDASGGSSRFKVEK